jgi:protein SCO1
MKLSLLAVLIALGASAEAQSTYGRPILLRNVGIDQKMGAELPLDIPFTGDQGRPVTLREYTGKPLFMPVSVRPGLERRRA